LLSSFLKAVKDYLKGFFLYSFMEGIHSEKRCLDNVFMLGLFGKAIGFPCLFNYYHLRLMPYYAGRLESWKKRVLKERDFFDHLRD
jgi:hypothetical protein